MTSFQLIVSLLPISNSITQGRYLKKSSLLKIMSKGQDPLVRDIGTKELRCEVKAKAIWQIQERESESPDED